MAGFFVISSREYYTRLVLLCLGTVGFDSDVDCSSSLLGKKSL
jgi:hypothetical protein